MQPVFTKVYISINETLIYYKIGRIKDHMFKYAGTERITFKPHVVDQWFELIFNLHEGMEDEINQTIMTSNYNTQVYLFELLKEFLTDWRIEKVNVELIKRLVQQYNDKTYAEFEAKIQNEIEKFQATPNFKREHLEEYEIEVKNLASLFGNAFSLPNKIKEKNYKFYCIHEKPKLIDSAYLSDYLDVVNKVITNFRNIVSKYVNRYNEGKIVPNAQIVIEKLLLPSNNQSLSLPDSSSVPMPKLKWNGTPLDFADTFAPLINARKIILKGEQKSDTNPIAKLLHSFFEIQKEKGEGEITAQSLQTYFKNNNANRGSKSTRSLKS